MLLTAAGVVIAALGDFSFDLFGYSMALTSVFFQVKSYVFFPARDLYDIFLPQNFIVTDYFFFFKHASLTNIST